MIKAKKRVFIFALILVLMLSTLTLYGFSATQSSAKKITLTIEASQNQKTNAPIAFYQPNIDAFQKKYPNIKVQLLLIPDAQAITVLQTKLAAAEPSDIIVYNKVSAENELNALKNFVDLTNEPWVKRLNNPEVLKHRTEKFMD